MKLSDIINFHPKQKQAWKLIGKGGKVFYGGARGGGKSYFALGSAFWVALQHPGITIVVIRKTYSELRDLFIFKMSELYKEKLFGYRYLKTENTAVFNNGSRILFRACDNIDDATKIQGVEYQYMIIDEAPNFPVDILHRIFGSLRNANIKTFKETILMTGNPGGISDGWFKQRFISPDYSKWTAQELEHKDSYKFVSANVHDNPDVGQSYIDNLMQLPEDLRKAWLDGSWDVFEGQFFTEWNYDVHVVETFEVPERWSRVAGFDLGYTKAHPSVCLWAAQDPETLAVYIYREYAQYDGCDEQYAREISDLMRDEDRCPVFGDPALFGSSIKKNYADESSDKIFEREGVVMLRANNDRINGWRIVKQWLHHDSSTPPRLFIMDCCPGLITTIPQQCYNKSVGNRAKREDLDTKGADDYVDALRYLLVSGFGYPSHSVVMDVFKKQAMDSVATIIKSNSRSNLFFDEDSEQFYANY